MSRPTRSAVRFKGLWYSSDCCHSCAQLLCAQSEGMTIDELNTAVEAGAEYVLGYEYEDGHFEEIAE